jgi:8-oxo-dGTP pyrophosphatase MutT (NUDIX family)
VNATTATPVPPAGGPTAPDQVPLSRTVVAVVVEWRGRIALFRRSDAVDHDRGRWHCVTGYVETDATPERQALVELYEETGLSAAALDSLDPGRVLHLVDGEGRLWQVHTYRAVTRQRRLNLDDEHDAYRWVLPSAIGRFGNRVGWLDDVLGASRHV